ncbi:Menaquinol-cytochrome c reductase cytochrome b subunit (modular protein) [Candidatus Methylomirabilis oxygeniifera]|uniref:Menaquinol-cytochrome c reductase cytochrome b subunit (Modular protein) n=1 Tax=Methylomirabilis oxygeniifera TaxID=671143 RepID=D5MLG7_METO1|nr:Menaquinol-cytochrome c reductase cytochrome b subunit (modular protein) [Candidatus Methylomirabilis oxyfera]
MMTDGRTSGIINRVTASRLWKSVFRHGYPATDLDRMSAMFTNFFLHLLPAKVHPNSLRLTYTWALGMVTFYLMVIQFVTGFLLMFFYIPVTDLAYHNMKDLQFAVSFGLLLRNMHRWAAHGMVALVFLHMGRVFYTASYRPPREFNWTMGVLLWLVTLFLSFTGYLLPWDQLAFWAITVGTSIAGYPPWIGETIRTLMLGGHQVGQGALLRFYVLHVAILPAMLCLLVAIHFWRVRKDGGLSRPEGPSPKRTAIPVAGGRFVPGPQKTYTLMEVVRGTSPMVGAQRPEDEVPAWPHLLFRLVVLFQVVLGVVVLLAIVFDAPLEELANPTHPPNPAKAPWYFLGLQELVSYSALVGGVVIPGLLVLGLMGIPYIDRTREGEGIWFTSALGKRIAAWSFVGTIPYTMGLLFLNARFGVRQFAPEAPQGVVDLLNPATLLLAAIVAFSVIVGWRTGSRRMAAIALFSAFVSAYVLLMIIGTYFRGPNWDWALPWR